MSLNATFRKSTASGNQGNCVEARLDADSVEVRDSKDQRGPTMRVSPQAWTSFLDMLRTDR